MVSPKEKNTKIEMPQKMQVPTLVDLTLSSIREFVTTETELICTTSTNPEYERTKLHSMLELVKRLLNLSIPQRLYDKISISVRSVIACLLTEASTNKLGFLFTLEKLREYRVVLQLTEVAIGAHLKAIEFLTWPPIMQDVLYDKLYDMVGLETLDLGSRWIGKRRPSDVEKMIASGVSAMPNLVCFILHIRCTDNIILALAQNCKKLQKLDVTRSTFVTECSVGPLLSCKHLRHIELHGTSVAIPDYANLLLEHLKIENIGICDRFGDILEHIHRKDIGIKNSFHVRTLATRIVSTKHLCLLIDSCPYITSLCLVWNCSGDLATLATLDYLKELTLKSCDFYAHGIKTLLEIKGCAIISLHLVRVRKIDLNALILISQYCPDIRDLVFDGWKLFENAALQPQKLAVRPFQFLERIECTAECTNVHLQFLLSHCINIKFIQLDRITKFGDDTMRRILLQNPMSKLEDLRILCSFALSMKTVQLLMQNCDNLRHLSDLSRWKGISSCELNIFRKQLKTTNTNLDTS